MKGTILDFDDRSHGYCVSNPAPVIVGHGDSWVFNAVTLGGHFVHLITLSITELNWIDALCFQGLAPWKTGRLQHMHMLHAVDQFVAIGTGKIFLRVCN